MYKLIKLNIFMSSLPIAYNNQCVKNPTQRNILGIILGLGPTFNQKFKKI